MRIKFGPKVLTSGVVQHPDEALTTLWVYILIMVLRAGSFYFAKKDGCVVFGIGFWCRVWALRLSGHVGRGLKKSHAESDPSHGSLFLFVQNTRDVCVKA